MASIQQSLNQLLGAAAGVATAGSYLYRQTPGYQARQYDKEAKAGEALIESGSSEFYENSEDFYKEQTRQAEEVLKAREKAYKTKPTVDRHEEYIRATKEYSDRLQEQREFAEQAGLDRLTKSTEAQTTQRQALKDRFDFLKSFSAKERGQFETAYNRHKNKGEID